jgi:hypothetical protein
VNPVERVVVALDAISENRTAIGTASRLAERWNAHLHGVFIEDEDIIRLAHMPFARQVTLGVGVETFTLRQAERQMRAFAERARHELAASAKRHGVEWSFEVVRGAGSAGVFGSAGDFLIAGTTTRPIGGHFRVEGRWWTVSEPGPATLLLAHRQAGPHGAVAALLRNLDPASERLLGAAARLAVAHDGRLVVLCRADIAAAPGFRAWLDQFLGTYEVSVELDIAPTSPIALARRIAELGCRLVAVEAGTDQARPERLRELVAKIACDVLVVR